MDFPCLKARCYDAFGVSATLFSGLVLLPCFTVATPAFAIPVLAHTALKVAYHGSRFFLEKKYTSIQSEPLQQRQFKREDLKFLKQEQQKLYHRGRMSACLEKIRIWLWGLIPGYGAWRIVAELNGPTNLSREALETDLVLVSRTIRHLESTSRSSTTTRTT